MNLSIEDEDINEDINVDWSLEVFCIHNNYLVEYSKKNDYKKSHYFVNCDCGREDKEECYYNNFYKNKTTFTINRAITKKHKKKQIEPNQTIPSCGKKTKNYDFLFNNNNSINKKN